jgi:hypothetical protein
VYRDGRHHHHVADPDKRASRCGADARFLTYLAELPDITDPTRLTWCERCARRTPELAELAQHIAAKEVKTT